MILHIGVKTIDPQLVAYKKLEFGQNEADAFAKLNAEVYEKGTRPKDPTMIIYYDPKEKAVCRREIIVPIDKDVEGLSTKTLPKIRAGFIVFSGTRHPVEYYYEQLRKHLEEHGLKASTETVCSIEAQYQPDQFNLSSGSFIDEDAQETWTTEILLPIEG